MFLFALTLILAGLLVAAVIFVPEMVARRRRFKLDTQRKRKMQALERQYPFSGLETADEYF